MSQRAMCNHLFLCHLFYQPQPPHHCCKPPPTFFSDLRCHSGSVLSPSQVPVAQHFSSRFCDRDWLRRPLCIWSALPHH